MECVGPAWIRQEFTTGVTAATPADSSSGGRASRGTPRPVPCGVAAQRCGELLGTARLADTNNACGQG